MWSVVGALDNRVGGRGVSIVGDGGAVVGIVGDGIELLRPPERLTPLA